VRPRVLGLLVGVLLGSAMAMAEPAPAQSPELSRAEAALEGGRFAEARGLVERWWEGAGREGASRADRERALWLRGRLSVDPEMAELDYRRLVVEFPGGPFSDQALFRLAQGAEARRDMEVAREYLEILLRDYPSSSQRPEARSRLARMTAGGDGPGPAASPGAAPAASPGATPVASPAPPSAEVGGYTVQLGAFSSEEAARVLAAEARAGGLEVRIVRVEGSPLYRVRLGAFPNRGDAEDAMRRAGERGFAGFVSGDRERERRVRPSP
jgi:hypothetical protein